MSELISMEYINNKFMPWIEQHPTSAQINRKRCYLKQTSSYDLLHFTVALALYNYINK